MPQFLAQDILDLEEVTRQWPSAASSVAESLVTHASGRQADNAAESHVDDTQSQVATNDATESQSRPQSSASHSSESTRRRRHRRRHRYYRCYHFHVSKSKFVTLYL